MKMKVLEKMIEESNRIVCLCGIEMTTECGYPYFRNDDNAYEIEQKYGYSPEELYSSVFYSNRKEKFYEFYKNEVLDFEDNVGESFYALAKLEELGKLSCVITRSFYGVARKAGCQNVIELLGNVYDYSCPKCHKKYTIDFVRESKGVPVCSDCHVALRPGVHLFGEMLCNNLLTRAAEEVSNADLLLVLGTTMNSFCTENMLKYYKGDNIILINGKEHFADNKATLVIHKPVKEIMPFLLEKYSGIV